MKMVHTLFAQSLSAVLNVGIPEKNEK